MPSESLPLCAAYQGYENVVEILRYQNLKRKIMISLTSRLKITFEYGYCIPPIWLLYDRDITGRHCVTIEYTCTEWLGYLRFSTAI